MVKKEVSEFRFNWKVFAIIISILVVLSFLAFYLGIIKKTCETEDCFSQSLQSCSMTQYLKLQNMNYYRYTIEGKRGDDCLIQVKLVKMAVGTPEDKIKLFEGKSMTCRIPKDKLSTLKSDNVEGMLNYCTGPLKEAMYQLIIEKLYTLIVSNMGDIVGKLEDVLAGNV